MITISLLDTSTALVRYRPSILSWLLLVARAEEYRVVCDDCGLWYRFTPEDRPRPVARAVQRALDEEIKRAEALGALELRLTWARWRT